MNVRWSFIENYKTPNLKKLIKKFVFDQRTTAVRATTFSKAAGTDRPNCPTKSKLVSVLYCASDKPNKRNKCRVSADTLHCL